MISQPAENYNYRVCTSSTRPGLPSEGLMIYETDTDKTYVYENSGWVLKLPGITQDFADAKGDIIVASADNAWARMAAGADYSIPQWLAAATNGLQALSAGTSWTPTLAQGVSTNITKTVVYAKYWRIAQLVFFSVRLSATAAGTLGSNITITLPVTASTTGLSVGSGFYLDSGTAFYRCIINLNSTTLSLLRDDSTSSAAGSIGSDPSLAVASNDTFNANGFYEA